MDAFVECDVYIASRLFRVARQEVPFGAKKEEGEDTATAPADQAPSPTDALKTLIQPGTEQPAAEGEEGAKEKGTEEKALEGAGKAIKGLFGD